MGLHKLTAGDGYTYLTRQVAAHDATEKGHASLGDYYTQRGESPGQWLGKGLTGLGMAPGAEVSVEQMKALFGDGRHPNAVALETACIAAGGSHADAVKAGALGRAFPVFAGANPFQTEVAKRFTAHNLARGLTWDAPIPVEVRARIRTDLGTEMFTETYARTPADARELSGFIARASRPATTAVAGYDLTFSPVKSVSTLWAIAPPALAGQIEAAHHAAVADTLRWLETAAAYTRTGRAGVRQVDVTGLIAAAFTHRDARSGDPDLHTHLAVSNKVQATDGRWLAVDGRVLYQAKVAASERYNTRLEAELITRIGVRFADRPGPDTGKRAVREIVGIDPALNALWSSRRAVIEVRRGELATRFQSDHGRPPTEIEAIALAQQATLETRPAKHEPRSHAEQRQAWRAQAVDVLGSPAAITRMVTRSTGRHQQPQRDMGEQSVTDIAATVLDVVASDRATWQVWHLRAEAERQARTAGIPRNELDPAVEQIVTAAVSASVALGAGQPITEADPINEPAALRRADGTSVYVVAGAARYTSATVIDAEQRLLIAAARHDGRIISAAQVDVAATESAANGVDLNPAQAQMVGELATSGARVQLAIAPAGSGKTTAMRVLARAWTDSGGTVIGLAPSARAAAELRREITTPTAGGQGDSHRIGGHCDTLAKLTHSLRTGRLPRWVDGIGPDTLVIIDEAGMAGTVELATTVDYVLARGGSVRLVGDDQQLASVAAGGILRDIAEQVGVVTLSALHRFNDPAEAGATLALRLGDPAGLAFYLDHDRIHVGDHATAVEQAYQAWSTDRAHGRDAIMLAPTRDLVALLNARARGDRLAGTDAPPQREVDLADGNRASVGDVVITRANERRIPISPSDWVKNGDRWQVHAVTADGALVVRHADTRQSVTLPSGYVLQHTELGYATTVHGAQGVTADTAHTVITGQESRQVFYVAMTRARTANHAYLVTAGDGDEHNIIKPETVTPPTATDILTAVLHRDQAQQSAASTAAVLADPVALLPEAVARYQDALIFAAETLVGEATLAALDAAAESLRSGLTDAPAYPTLRANLVLLAVDGHDPIRLLTDAATRRELESALDAAAVIDTRIGSASPGTGSANPGRPRQPAIGTGPLPWLPAIPAPLTQHSQWGGYLTARAALVSELAGRVRAESAEWTPTTSPVWARRLLEPNDRELRGDLAIWRAATTTPTQDRRPTGPPQLGDAASGHQRTLDQRVTKVLGDPHAATAAFASLATGIDARIVTDPYWPELAERLAAIGRAGIDAAGLLTAVGTDPLPDDHPAAALWWRLSRHLTPAATAATARSGAATLRPAWTPLLIEQLGAARAARVMEDPAWTALVAAVDNAPRGEWTPTQLLSTALQFTLANTANPTGSEAMAGLGGSHARDADLASALVWRVAMLTDPAPLDYESKVPDPSDEQSAPPPDLHLLAATPAGQYRQNGHSGAPTDRGRLIELNSHARDFFTARYDQSWAPDYMRDRLGTDLSDDKHFRPGYAPAAWTRLTDHLRHLGAADQEILAAGLARRTGTGRVIDAFRDRLVFPIHGPDGDVHGFIGRRNPSNDLADARSADAGPKYLNTPQTELFDKGRLLFGPHETRDALADGARPVLVEGPFDAIAVTLAGNGHHVGVTALGTAFTDAQAEQLRPYLGTDSPGVLVATDNDAAGWTAAKRAYWLLTARGDSPGHVILEVGKDPASTFHTVGGAGLRRLFEESQPLARSLINDRISALAGQLDTAEAHVAATRAAAQVIGALPPPQWLQHIDYVTELLNAAPGAVHLATVDAGLAWTDNPDGLSHQQIQALARINPVRPLRDVAASARRSEATAVSRTGVHEDQSPETRWRAVVDHIDTRIARSDGWPALAATLDRAIDQGIDIETSLPSVATTDPLPARRTAQELQYRILGTFDITPDEAAEPMRTVQTHQTRMQPRPAVAPSVDHLAGPTR